jgi:prophage antirepressor-like protein
MATKNRLLEYMLPTLYEHGEIREVVIDGDTWFVAADVCAALGVQNPSQTVRTLAREDWRHALVGEVGMLVVSEPGVYEMVTRSRTPQGRAATRQLVAVLVEHGPSVEEVMKQVHHP